MRTCLLLTITVLSFSCSSPEEERSRPNIVFIMSDDHAVRAIGAYGSVVNETPSIDRLADEGMIFHRSYVTNSICGPSRAVMLTGKFSHLNGFRQNGDRFDGSQQTFPKLLQKAGYKTAMIGKWHLGTDPTGFDYWTVLPGQGDYYHPDFITMGQRARERGYTSDIITDKAIGWLDSAAREDQPFAILVHHKAPHRTWMPAVRDLKNYQGRTVPEPFTLFDNYETRESTAGAQEMSISDHLMDNYDLFLGVGMNEPGDWGDAYLNRQTSKMDSAEIAAWEEAYRADNEEFFENMPEDSARIRWNYQRYMRNYLSVVDGLDNNIGRLLDYLDERGLDENTIVVYTSDQGFYLGDHGWYDKRWMYEESFRMPLVIRYPEHVKKGTSSHQLVQNIDFAPTLLELAGIDVPADMQGKSMRNILEGDTSSDHRNSVYYHYYEYPGVHAVKRHYGVMKDNFKLIHYYFDVDTWEMYDLDSDPDETNNIYENPEYENIRNELEEELLKLQLQYADTVKAGFLPPTRQQIEHMALGAKVDLVTPPHPRYSKEIDLTDGSYMPANRYFKSYRNDYIGFNDRAELLLDLGAARQVSEVRIHTLRDPNTWIHYPEGIKIEISGNGRDYTGIEDLTITTHPANLEDYFYGASFAGVTARYLRISVSNQASIPEGNPGAGEPAWLFMDEVLIN